MSEDHGVEYLIWSNEHKAWWGPGGRGYTSRLSEAGCYLRRQALSICSKAIVGTSSTLGQPPELPVRLTDLEAMLAEHDKTYGGMRERPWT